MLKRDAREGSTGYRIYFGRKLSSGKHSFIRLEMFSRNLAFFIKSCNENGINFVVGAMTSVR